MPVIYDTGSFEILVLSTKCQSCSGDHTFYNNKKSATFVSADGATAEHLFGSGPVLSEKGFEKIRIGRQQSPYLVNKMPFWQVVDHGIAVWNQNAHFSGIVGLGHPDRIPEGFSPARSPDETLLNKLGVGKFAICLQRNGPPAVSPGWLMMGPSIDNLAGESSKFKSAEVVGKVHWGVKIQKVELGWAPGVRVPDPCKPSCGAIVDSGTSLLAVPPAARVMVNRLRHMIRYDCSNLNELPTLKMEVGGHPVELPPQAYVVQGYGGCEPGFMHIDKQSQFGPVWILGMPFLRYYFAIFDRMNLKIHIAESTPACHMPTADMILAPASHIAAVNATALANSSNLRAGTKQGSRMFSSADYQPTTVDMNATRLPGWATEGQNMMNF
jgi:hypothetical protein